MNEVRITLRIPDELHGHIIASTEANGRSMNAEIIHRLQKSFEAGDKNDLTTLLSRALTIAEAHGLGDLQWREIDIKRYAGE